MARVSGSSYSGSSSSASAAGAGLRRLSLLGPRKVLVVAHFIEIDVVGSELRRRGAGLRLRLWLRLVRGG